MPARRLYEKYGFRPVGIRPRYYSDNGEDALIMTTDALDSAGHARAGGPPPRRRSRLAPIDPETCAARDADPPPGDERTADERADDREPPLVLAVESSCDETGIALVEGGRRIHVERRREPGRAPRADRRDRPRGRGPRPPALDPAGARRGVARARALVGRRRRRRGHPRARASRARCSSGSTSPRRSPGSTTSRSSA